MSDRDLSRPLAPCSLNFALADVTITDRSGVTTIIPGTYGDRSDCNHDGEQPLPVESEEEEVKLTKCPYDPDPEPRPRCRYTTQTTVSENGTAGQVSEFEMVSLPHGGDLRRAAANRDRAAIRVIMEFRKRDCRSLTDKSALQKVLPTCTLEGRPIVSSGQTDDGPSHNNQA